MHGYYDPRFHRVATAFGKLFGSRLTGGGALCVYDGGLPVVDIWGGTRDAKGSVAWEESTGALIYSASKGLSALVLHRLADRGLIDYDAPVADYWPEFGRHGKARITVRELLHHRAGLSQLRGIAYNSTEMLDHNLIQRRIANAAPDRYRGVPTYHALTFGWALAGLAAAVTGLDMRELYQRELCDPLGIDELSVGTPPAGSNVTVADFVDPFKTASLLVRDIPLALGTRLPRPFSAMSGSVFAGSGSGAIFRCSDARILDAQMPAANAIATARALARVYAPLATDGTVGEHRLLSTDALRAFDNRRTWQIDRGLGQPMSWNMGFHRTPIPLLSNGFGHVGFNGCFGWADPSSGLSIGFIHNRLPSTISLDLGTFLWLLPAIDRAARTGVRRPLPNPRPILPEAS